MPGEAPKEQEETQALFLPCHPVVSSGAEAPIGYPGASLRTSTLPSSHRLDEVGKRLWGDLLGMLGQKKVWATAAFHIGCCSLSELRELVPFLTNPRRLSN